MMRLWMLRLLVLLLLTLGASLTWAILDRHTMPDAEELASRSAQRGAVLESVGRLLLEWHEQDAGQDIDDYLGQQRARGLFYALLDARGELLAGEPPIPDLAQLAETALGNSGYAFKDGDAPGMFPPPPMAPPPLECLAFHSPEGDLYAVALRRDAPPLLLVRQPRHLAYIVLGALVAMLVYFALCRVSRLSGTASKELRSAMRRLAQGDFAARLDPAMDSVETPYADLAKDFNLAVTSLADKQAEQRYVLTELAHNMSASLARMALAVELAGNTSPERAAQLLERIKADSGQLTGITEQLMGCVREEWHESEKKPLALHELLHHLTMDANAHMVSEGRRVVFSASSDCAGASAVGSVAVCSVQGNEAQLSSMIRNILGNALRHTPPCTQVVMQLSADHVKGQARIEIVDQGPGLPPDMLERVFRPFQQGTGLRGEAGLGLAIARLVCERHGGSITLHNQPDGGLGAVMLLPLCEEIPSRTLARSVRGHVVRRYVQGQKPVSPAA